MRERSVVTTRSSNRPVDREMAEMVGGHVQLESVARQAVGRSHHARIVHDDVQAGVIAEHGIGGTVHGDEVGKVEVHELEGRSVELALQLVAGPACLLLVSAGEDHVRTVVGQGLGGLVADAAVGPGHERHPAGQVADVLGSPGGALRRLAPGYQSHAFPMWSAGTVPSLPASKSSKAWMISARVFITKGPCA